MMTRLLVAMIAFVLCVGAASAQAPESTPAPTDETKIELKEADRYEQEVIALQVRIIQLEAQLSQALQQLNSSAIGTRIDRFSSRVAKDYGGKYTYDPNSLKVVVVPPKPEADTKK